MAQNTKKLPMKLRFEHKNNKEGAEIMKKFILMLMTVLGFLMSFSNGFAEEKINNDSKEILVAYFSATGNTKRVAQMINSNVNSDIFEIIPEISYTNDDLNYNNSNSRTSKERANKTMRPAIKNKVTNLNQYSIIFLGYPIWWGEAPRIINTFVENNNLSGKTIIPFVTSGSSGIGSSAKELSSQAKGVNWKGGRRFDPNVSNDEVKKWIDSLDL